MARSNPFSRRKVVHNPSWRSKTCITVHFPRWSFMPSLNHGVELPICVSSLPGGCLVSFIGAADQSKSRAGWEVRDLRVWSDARCQWLPCPHDPHGSLPLALAQGSPTQTLPRQHFCMLFLSFRQVPGRGNSDGVSLPLQKRDHRNKAWLSLYPKKMNQQRLDCWA